MFPMLVFYSRLYASVCDIKENAHMLYWKSVDHDRPTGLKYAIKARTKMIV